MTSSDDHVKQALRDLRSLVDAEYPVTTLQSDDARSIVDRAWSAAADGFDRDDVGGQNALRVLRQLRRVDDLLHDARNTAATEVSTRLGEILERLDAAPCTVEELVNLAPQFVIELGFDRALLSVVSDGYWVPRTLQIVDNPGWATEILQHAQRSGPQRLVPELFETELVRRRQPILVRNVQSEVRVHKPIADASRAQSYVAAPIVAGGNVLGFIHADRYIQGTETDLLDRAVLSTFTEGLRLALSRAQLAERLDEIAGSLRNAATTAEQSVRDARAVDLAPPPAAITDRPGSLAALRSRRPVPAVESVRERLTPRENQVLGLLSQGRTNAAIAIELVITEATVKKHVKNILRKLRVANRTEAVSRMRDGF
ncbi:LuxR C-terminal-related transcriptional regulator [Gordonia lacunae]|uniref:LuxR C-terminal-related transcriptional regulator n=1 Tax=Gordonia lacunae TaxID=417102 RepID=UPI0039E26F4E